MSEKKTPWSEEEKKNWLLEQKVKRSYLDDVVSKIEKLKDTFDVRKYGALSYAPEKYPLYLIKNLDFDSNKKTILITGGVHGYETSGVHGALSFLEDEVHDYIGKVNVVVAPCISPWGYETINRWNPNTIDPNRSFFKGGPAEECSLFLEAIEELELNIFAHIDLHETTDTDNTVFRPALASRDAIEQKEWDIPDGFYLVGNSDSPNEEFQKAMIDSVREVTHIAPADKDGKIIGEDITQEGVINYPIKSLNLCAGFSSANYCSTTEVYPDSPSITASNCVVAQVACISGGLDYLVQKYNL